MTVACAECGHLHFEGQHYSPCPIDGCDCQGQAWVRHPNVSLQPAPLYRVRFRNTLTGREVVTVRMNEQDAKEYAAAVERLSLQVATIERAS